MSSFSDRNPATKLRAAICLLGVVVLVGCGAKESSLVGTWKGKPSPDEAKNPISKAMIETTKLEIKEDHTFAMTVFIEIDGTWSFQGDTITLKVTKMAGMDISEAHKMAAKDGGKDNLDKPILLQLSADGKTLTATKMQTGKAPDQTMTFTK